MIFAVEKFHENSKLQVFRSIRTKSRRDYCFCGEFNKRKRLRSRTPNIKAITVNLPFVGVMVMRPLLQKTSNKKFPIAANLRFDPLDFPFLHGTKFFDFTLFEMTHLQI
jgi:hypothetical protein